MIVVCLFENYCRVYELLVTNEFFNNSLLHVFVGI